MEQYTALPAHPLEVAERSKVMMTAIILGGRLQSSATYAQLNMERENEPLYDFLTIMAKHDEARYREQFDQQTATDVKHSLFLGSYAAYSALAMPLDGHLPSVPPKFLAEIVSQQQSSFLMGHEWHHAVHSNPCLRSILEVVHTRLIRPTMHTHNAVFRGGGVVSHIINQYVAWLN